MTTMSRLSEKGVLNRQREGLAYVYTPAISEDEFVAMVVRQVLDGLLDDYSDMAIEYLVDYLARNSPSELARLQQTIQARIIQPSTSPYVS
jgi:predicted transcriptional regulator